jgi:hypothetical protein
MSGVILVGVALAMAPGLAPAQSQNGSGSMSDGSGQVSDGTQPAGQGTPKPDQSTGKTPGKTGQSAGDVGDRLHDSAKSFGEALLGGIKYAGRTVINFFNDDK